MNLQTKIKLSPSNWKIDLNNSFFTVGSCFSDEMANYLQKHKFKLIKNPTGISYNPHSISETFDYLLGNKTFNSDEIFDHRGLFNHFDFHGSFSGLDKNLVSQNMKASLGLSASSLLDTDCIIITLGTAFAFKHKVKNQIVNNCHKVANEAFEKTLLSVEGMVQKLTHTFNQIKALNKNVNIIMTVSPIRHIRDGLVNNQISKSSLILACHHLVDQFDFVSYFPSFEIIMDELRDYRFYKDDMIHPTPLAVSIIIDKFIDQFFSDECKQALLKIDKINQRLDHKSFNPTSKEHIAFLIKTRAEIAIMNNEFSLNYEKELKLLDQRIAQLSRQ